MTPPLQAAGKPEGYYAQDRAELVRLLPRPLGRVLDVGCGEGAAATPLREAGAGWISGVELHAPAAERARAGYDEVLAGRAEAVLDELTGHFDTILLYDVLEHLPEPSLLLRELHRVAGPAARLHVSVPNARHWTLLRDLALRGTFGYTTAGHRDETHLRWFTRRDLVALLESTGWEVVETAHGALQPFSRAASRLTRGLMAELLVYQLFALARGRAGGPATGR